MSPTESTIKYKNSVLVVSDDLCTAREYSQALQSLLRTALHMHQSNKRPEPNEYLPPMESNAPHHSEDE